MAKNDSYDTGATTEPESPGLRDRLSDAGGTARDQIDAAPLIALGAGAALGAVIGALLPRSQREAELLAPVGGKLNEAGRGAVDRARDMSKQKFDEIAGDKVREFFGLGSSDSSKA